MCRVTIERYTITSTSDRAKMPKPTTIDRGYLDTPPSYDDLALLGIMTVDGYLSGNTGHFQYFQHTDNHGRGILSCVEIAHEVQS